MKKVYSLLILLCAAFLIAGQKNNGYIETYAANEYVYYEDFESYSVGTVGDEVYQDKGLFWFDSSSSNVIQNIDGNKKMVYSTLSKDAGGYTKLGGMGTQAHNNLDKLIEGNYYELSLYLDIKSTSDSVQFWVEYQNNSIGWTGVVFDANLNVNPVYNANTFNVSYQNKILKFQFVAGLYSGKPSYVTMTLKDSNIGDQIIVDDFIIKPATPIYVIDFASETVGDSAPKSNPSDITNVYNKSVDSLTIAEEGGNKYLLVQKNSSGSCSFYFNSIGFLKNEELYHITVEFISHNASAITIAYNDPEDSYRLNFSGSDFISSTGDPFLSNPSFDGTILSFDLVPSTVISENHYRQFAITITSTSNVLAKINKVQIEQTIDESKDIIFKQDSVYVMDGNLLTTPKTFMVNLNLKGYQTLGGVIFGNNQYSNNSINYEIVDGSPKIIYRFANGDKYDYLFDSVDVRSNEFVNLTVVTESSLIKCYLNGELKQSLPFNLEQFLVSAPFVIGGDLSVNNNDYFKGKIRNITLWSDARTAEEVQQDNSEITLNDENLLVNYDLRGKQDSEIIFDSKNNINVVLQGLWLNENSPEPEYDYSFAVVGDTQILTSFFPDDLHYIYDYLSQNIENKKISHVFGMGDITDKDTDEEWTLAVNQISKLDGKVPYSLTRGNHDSNAQFNKYFGDDSLYANQYILKYKDDSTTTAHVFSAGKLDYLVITLDWGPTDEELAWANQIVAAYPKHNVIISTHAYLNSDGTYLDAGDSLAPTNSGKPGANLCNNGDDIFEKLVKKHSNIVLVLCGHVDVNGVVMKKAIGENGNNITELLINPQGLDLTYGSTGLVSMLYFSDDGKHVDLQYYSTVHSKFKSRCAFSFTLNTMEAEDRVESIEVTPPEKLTYNYGEDLDLDNLVVIRKWRSGKEDILLSSEYTVSGYHKTILGKQTVTVSAEGFTSTFDVYVEDYVLSRNVTLPTKTEYRFGEELDLSGFTARVAWASGKTVNLSASDCEITGYNKNTLGTQTIYIDVCGQMYLYEVHVIDFVDELQITLPIKTEYKLFEDIDLTGLVVKEIMASGAERIVDESEYLVSGYSKYRLGTQTITVTVGEVSTSFEVTVNDYIKSIKIVPPTKIEYEIGEELDLSGAKVKVEMASGIQSEYEITANMVSGFNSSVVGENIITISFNDLTFNIKLIIKTAPQPEPEPDPQPEPEGESEPAPAKKKCGGSIVASSILVSTLALAGVGLLVSKKRKQD